MLRAVIVLALFLVTGFHCGAVYASEDDPPLIERPLPKMFDYPLQDRTGNSGHRGIASVFTGRWYCLAVGLGTLGRSIPLVGFSITDESLVAIVAINLQTRKIRSFAIRSDLEFTTRCGLYVLGDDRICVLLSPKKNRQTEEFDSVIAEVGLKEGSVKEIRAPYEDAEQRIAATWPLTPIPDQIGKTIYHAAGGDSAECRWFVRKNDEPCRLILAADALRDPILLHGTKLGQAVACSILNDFRFSLSEIEYSKNRREIWLLSESAFRSAAPEKPVRIDSLYLANVPVSPIGRLLVFVKFTNGHLVLFAIVEGRLSTVKEFRSNWHPVYLSMSADGRFSAMQLRNSEEQHHLVLSIDLNTGKELKFKDQSDTEPIFLRGIMDSGQIIQQGGRGTVYLTNPFQDPQLVAKFILDQKQDSKVDE